MGLFNTYKSSGEKTTSGVIKASAGYLGGIVVLTDGTNDATVILYDNASAGSGTKLLEVSVPGANNYGEIFPPLAITFTNGCYASISGTGASCIVYYQ